MWTARGDLASGIRDDEQDAIGVDGGWMYAVMDGCGDDSICARYYWV